MAKLQLDILKLELNGTNYNLTGTFNEDAGAPILTPVPGVIPRIDDDPNKNFEKFMRVDIAGLIGARVDFEYLNLNYETDYGAGDHLDLIAVNSTNPLNPGDVEVGSVVIKDTKYPPPYKPHTRGTEDPNYEHHEFSKKFKITEAQFVRDKLNPHLFKVNFKLTYDTAIYNYAPEKMSLEWDMARPGLDAIVIHVKPAAMGTPNVPLEFPLTGSFLVQLDSYSYKKDGLSVIITEKELSNENRWADLDLKKMSIFIDSLYPI